MSSPGLDYLTSVTSGESSSQKEENSNFHVILSAINLPFTQNMDDREGIYMWPIKQMILLYGTRIQLGWIVLAWLNVYKGSLHPCLKSIASLYLLQLQNTAVTLRMTRKCKLDKSHVVSSAFPFITIPMALWGTLLWRFVPVDASKIATGGVL